MNKMNHAAQSNPTIVEVREAYIDRKDFEDQIGHVERRGDKAAGAEFDRWLAEHDAQVWEQGVIAGHECVGAERNDRCTVQNPYRAGVVVEVER